MNHLFFKVFCIVTLLISFFPITSYSSEVKSNLDKYMKPAEITQLDWELMELYVSDLIGIKMWDSVGLIISSTIYSIKNRKQHIGLTFIIDNSKYVSMDNKTLEKIFLYVVERAYSLIKIHIPEADLEKDIYANFLPFPTPGESRVVAVYMNGKISFRE